MCSDHPEFRARLQTISAKHMRACKFWLQNRMLNSKFGGPIATANLSDRQDA
jgi:hypothetical protein